MKVAVIGTGYVGLVSGACFAEMGCQVVCVDEDESKIGKLKNGVIPSFEPGLEPLVRRNSEDGRLRFASSVSEALIDTDVCFIAVGTPSNGDGSADLTQVFAAAREIGRNLNAGAVIAIKSTVSVGTAEKAKLMAHAELNKRGVKIACDVASNPEFLKEGAAVKDFMSPDRVIIGTDSERAHVIA